MLVWFKVNFSTISTKENRYLRYERLLKYLNEFKHIGSRYVPLKNIRLIEFMEFTYHGDETVTLL